MLGCWEQAIQLCWELPLNGQGSARRDGVKKNPGRTPETSALEEEMWFASSFKTNDAQSISKHPETMFGKHVRYLPNLRPRVWFARYAGPRPATAYSREASLQPT